MNICQMCTHNGQKNKDDDFACDIKCDEYLEFVILPVYKSAPDMYEALRAIVNWYEVKGEILCTNDQPYELLKQALRKAEGRTD